MNFFEQHPAVVAIGGYWIFSAVVAGMPPVTAASGPGYAWLYNSLHVLAGNLTQAFEAKFPNVPAGSIVEHTTRDTTVIANTEEEKQ